MEDEADGFAVKPWIDEPAKISLKPASSPSSLEIKTRTSKHEPTMSLFEN